MICLASLDGSIGFLLPIPEKTYRRLLMLQNTLNSLLPHLAGLNPKAYRLATQFHRPRTSIANTVAMAVVYAFLVVPAVVFVTATMIGGFSGAFGSNNSAIGTYGATHALLWCHLW